ncbi:deoxyribodipyrimidine photo-lyase [Arenibacter sp. GZD96]|uniref:cryptochrome/photolyase family protein n=1 Tax=Aurantibrevibacter litoralis TaxID=3106030 RepID=UPI002AFEA1EE|nr:deoxyribodipyrimidine photo-lyase [Arenibacter sp. GZD-96]MEA1786209.1 deoxyribodipyrimidine photo-lyase [Arenibacter sp. GZD-96]
MNKKVTVFWFRRDLRVDDNSGLFHALHGAHPVLPIFIFDPEILQHLPKDDARVSFIFEMLRTINNHLKTEFGSGVALYFDTPEKVFLQLLKTYTIDCVYTNHDYEPYAKQRDQQIGNLLSSHGIGFKTYKDQVIFEKNEVVKDDGNPYVVYTPYMRKWKSTFIATSAIKEYDTAPLLHKLHRDAQLPKVSLSDMGFEAASIGVPDYVATQKLIQNYDATRDYPAIKNGTSRLGPHLRFGTVSIRKMIKKAISEDNEVFWNELIWREFFMQILWHYPHTVHAAFKPKYDRIEWRNNPLEFEKWKNGQTGYPLVDAGMRELNATGFMHNRVRMLAASFLCKHLLIDWRWGEAYFAEKLLDYELSSNVGNWQWAAGSGVDAAPYFRIFNPMTQVAKFDKERQYINRWVPDLQELTYPQPMVDHKMVRERCLDVYKKAVG